MKPDPPQIRSMTPADLPAVLLIAAACPEAPRWRPSDFQPYLYPTPDSPQARTAIVAVSASRILGFAAATLLLDGQQNRCDLDSIAVLPDACRRGLGTALLRAVLAWSAAAGARRLSLEVRAGNTPAIRLYERFGLRPEGRRPRYYSHPEEDALLMGITITSVHETHPFSTEK